MSINWPNCVRSITSSDLRDGEISVGYRFDAPVVRTKRHSDERAIKPFVPAAAPAAPKPSAEAHQLALSL